MPYDKLVDSAKLDNAITQTANAIRAKTGSADLIDWNTDTGFADAIGSMSGGNISYQIGYRLNSSGEQIEYDGYATSDYISCELNNVVYLLNIYMESGVENAGNLRIAFYDSNKVHLGQTNATGAGDNLNGKYEATDGSLSQFTVKSFTDCDLTNVKYIRLCSTKLDGDSVVIVTESGGGSGGSGDDNINIVHKKDVNFYDYDGTLLHSYTIDEVKHLTKLPELPEQKGLICQGWNWSLEDIKAHNRAIDVGATYITDDGKTRIYITLVEGRTSPMLGIHLNGTVTVDWGDGSEPDILTGTSVGTEIYTPTHNYAKPGDYIISLAVVGSIRFGGNSTYGSSILRKDVNASNEDKVYRNSIKKINLGDGAISFADYAFYNCCSLTSITIPNGVGDVGTCMFYHCRSLTFIVIPNGTTSINSNAFASCYSLTSITIPDSVIRINSNTFSNCQILKSAALPNGVIQINSSAFNNCCSLTSITIPDSVTRIDNDAFYNCQSLAFVEISHSVTSINSKVFCNCYSLASIVIPNNVISIDGNAFNNCYGIRYYDFSNHTTVPTLSNTNAFYGIPSDCEIRVSAALYDEWIAATNWSTYASQIVAV